MLPDIDLAWSEALRMADLDKGKRALLLRLRKYAEHAAEHVPKPPDVRAQNLRFVAVPVIIEMDDDVPESQVDWALATAADAVPDLMSSRRHAWLGLTFSPVFIRYHDLTVVPLAEVHNALVAVAAQHGSRLSLSPMPFHARPSAARCAPIFLRFVVGVASTQGRCDFHPDRSRWNSLEDAVTIVLSTRLRTHVKVNAACRPSFYGAAHGGLRQYQAARLLRIIEGVNRQRDISALLDLRHASIERRVRLTLIRGRSPLAACMLQMPLDEGVAGMCARITKWLGNQGVTDITSRVTDARHNESYLAVLALPL